MINRHDGLKWTWQLRRLIEPDYAHALSGPIVPLQCNLQPSQQVRMLESRAGCWDGHTVIINVICPPCNKYQTISVIHILECEKHSNKFKFLEIEKKAKCIIADLESEFGEEDNFETGPAANQEVMLQLPSVTEVSDVGGIFIYTHQMDNAFLNNLKELYTEVIDYFNKE